MSTITKLSKNSKYILGVLFFILSLTAYADELKKANGKPNVLSNDSAYTKERLNEDLLYKEAASIGLNPLEATYYVQRIKASYNGANISDDMLIIQNPLFIQSTFTANAACNLGFESELATSFYTAGSNYLTFANGSAVSPLMTTSNIPTNGRHTLMYDKSIKDPTGGFSIVAPGWSASTPNNLSLRIGNSMVGAEKESVKVRYTIDHSNPAPIAYSYAVVLQDPGDEHLDSDKPYFEVKAWIEGQQPYNCASFKIIAGQGKAGYTYTDDFSKLYKGWTSNVINVVGLPGYNSSTPQTVVIEFTTADCTLGGHYGYAYVDLHCDIPKIQVKGGTCLGNASTFNCRLIGNNKKEDVKWTFKDGTTSFLELTGTIITDQYGAKQMTFNSNTLIPSYQDLEKFIIDQETTIEKPKIIFNNFTGPTIINVDLDVKLYDENNQSQCINSTSTSFTLKNCNANLIKCKDCITSFAPIPGNKYIISAWAREEVENALGYSKPTIGIVLNGVAQSFQFKPTGKVIDGWQKIESEFVVPEGTYSIDLELYNDDENSSQYVYFDDIRVQPFKSSLKSFVYDAKSQKMVAELDENNYATFYQYDEEGQLIRVKKETERGVMTIKEHNTLKANRQ